MLGCAWQIAHCSSALISLLSKKWLEANAAHQAVDSVGPVLFKRQNLA